jgi:hypothetical protein
MKEDFGNDNPFATTKRDLKEAAQAIDIDCGFSAFHIDGDTRSCLGANLPAA